MTMPERPDDELLSAILDGEATGAEIRAVEADPRARARLEELREVRILLGSSPEPTGAPPAHIAVGAALAEFDRRNSSVDEPSPEGSVTPLPTRGRRNRRRPAGRSESYPRAMVAAAAIVLVVVVGIGILTRVGTGSGGQNEYAATAATTTEAAGVDSAAAGTVELAPQAMEDAAGGSETTPPRAAAESGAAALTENGAATDSEAVAETTITGLDSPPIDPELQRCATDLGLIGDDLVSTEQVDDAAAGLTLDVTTIEGERFRIRFDPTDCRLLEGPTPLP